MGAKNYSMGKIFSKKVYGVDLVKQDGKFFWAWGVGNIRDFLLWSGLASFLSCKSERGVQKKLQRVILETIAKASSQEKVPLSVWAREFFCFTRWIFVSWPSPFTWKEQFLSVRYNSSVLFWRLLYTKHSLWKMKLIHEKKLSSLLGFLCVFFWSFLTLNVLVTLFECSSCQSSMLTKTAWYNYRILNYR